MHSRLVFAAALVVVATATQAQDVGVVKAGTYCPAGSQEFAIKMDNQDQMQSRIEGWRPLGISLDGYYNITYRFCRVDGSRFVGAPGEFAVLRLADSCPAGSEPFERLFDNENYRTGNILSPAGANIWPNTVGLYHGGDTRLYFCRFPGGGAGRFPYLGPPYAVFASQSALGPAYANAWGKVYNRDEYSNNHNLYRWWPYPGSTHSDMRTSPYSLVINGEADTNLFVARPIATPTTPVAVCNADPTWGVYGLYTTLSATGSYARDGKSITEYRWSFDDGSPDEFAQSVSHSYYAPEWPGPGRTYYPRLTVTDNAGEQGSVVCPVTVYTCEEASYGEPCP